MNSNTVESPDDRRQYSKTGRFVEGLLKEEEAAEDGWSPTDTETVRKLHRVNDYSDYEKRVAWRHVETALEAMSESGPSSIPEGTFRKIEDYLRTRINTHLSDRRHKESNQYTPTP
ncbi:MAG: hypothetical protein ABEJ03_03145 [Candidatus Nanohaloarchaea archaeon]